MTSVVQRWRKARGLGLIYLKCAGSRVAKESVRPLWLAEGHGLFRPWADVKRPPAATPACA